LSCRVEAAESSYVWQLVLQDRASMTFRGNAGVDALRQLTSLTYLKLAPTSWTVEGGMPAVAGATNHQ